LLKDFLSHVGHDESNVTEEDVTQYLETADSDSDGKISLAEFEKLLTSSRKK
jgi:Ca2+-binding EF-hand superfamily protein